VSAEQTAGADALTPVREVPINLLLEVPAVDEDGIRSQRAGRAVPQADLEHQVRAEVGQDAQHRGEPPEDEASGLLRLGESPDLGTGFELIPAPVVHGGQVTARGESASDGGEGPAVPRPDLQPAPASWNLLSLLVQPGQFHGGHPAIDGGSRLDGAVSG
jgi:hypothetical protein